MRNRLINTFKTKLKEESVLGIFMKSGDPAFVEAVGYAGIDFVILDMEHGPASIESMQNNIRAAEISGTLPIIRIDELTEHTISKALDIGALGIQVPQITSAEQVREVVKAAKFYPQGERGVCRFVRAANYSAMPKTRYFTEANDNIIIIQLEGREAIENIDSILEVEGIDIIFIGPYDLSQSLGVPGDTTNPVVIKSMTEIVNKAKANNIYVGTFTDSFETMKLWKEAGVNYVSYSVDVGIFYESCSSLASQFKSIH